MTTPPKIMMTFVAMAALALGATVALHAEATGIPSSAAATGARSPAARAQRVTVKVDWPAFMARQDLVWDVMPGGFDDGAFLGNGMLGCTIYQEGTRQLRFEMGRSDVTEHRRDNARIPIGGFILTTVGKIQSGKMRLDLWNAELRGTLVTDMGTITFRSLVHTDRMVMLTDLQPTGAEQAAAISWNPAPCVDRPGKSSRYGGSAPNDPPNPPHVMTRNGSIHCCLQPRFAGGGYATVWTETPIHGGRRLCVSIADTFPDNNAATQATAHVNDALSANFDHVLQSHRDWWHAFYPKNFVSVPDPRLESFYWIQWYKLASASRPERVPVDLMGPWGRVSNWPRIWWNLNIQTLYLPVYTGNRLDLGESFINFIDKKRDNFFRNGKEIWKFDDCATVPHNTDYEGLRGDGDLAPDHFLNPGDFTWALHNYYLHYRYSMDHSLVTNQEKHAFYPLLKASVNLYLKLLEKGEDGKLHLPVLHSPEYGNDADNNYNLSLLRWGCQALIDLNTRYQLRDPMAPTWTQTLKDLVAYPVDANGLKIGATVPFVKSHRHWAHLLMIHPLHIMSADQPADHDLINKTIKQWLTVGNGKEIYGWSSAAAASLYATLGDGDNAIIQIHRHMADQRFVRRNTMYIEGSPVIECSIILNRSLQDMLLQSWGNAIRVFPAIPAAWKQTVFHELRAEGAFLVSALRNDGATAWVRIKSLAGEPCRIHANFKSAPTLQINGKAVTLKPTPDGIYELPLKKGDEAILLDSNTRELVVKELPR